MDEDDSLTSSARPYIAFPKIGEGGPPGFPEASVAELWGFAMAVDEDDHSEFLIPNSEFSLCSMHKNTRRKALYFGRVLYLLLSLFMIK